MPASKKIQYFRASESEACEKLKALRLKQAIYGLSDFTRTIYSLYPSHGGLLVGVSSARKLLGCRERINKQKINTTQHTITLFDKCVVYTENTRILVRFFVATINICRH